MAGCMSTCWAGRGKMSSCLLFLAMMLPLLIYFTSAPILVNAGFPSYEDCAPYTLANSTIQYPFGTCGFIDVWLDDNDRVHLDLGGDFSGEVIGDISNSSYSNRILQIAQDDIGDPFTTVDWINGNSPLVNLSQGYIAGTIVNCTQQSYLLDDLPQSDSMSMFDCRGNNSQCFFYPQKGLHGCTSYPIIVPKNYSINNDTNFEQLKQIGFQITWSLPESCNSCRATGGRCYGYGDYEPYCVCTHDDVRYWNCSGSLLDTRVPRDAIAGLFFLLLAVFSIVVISCIAIRRRSCCCLRTSSEEEQSILAFMEPVDSRPPSVENFLHYYSSQMPTRYSYAQIIAYTNNLSDKVGKGGFGTVYKGKLPTGRLIAVKILDESKQSEQQFIAEVATVGRTYHVNLVRLLGYCSQASKRALVYEYMVNGSLDRYIHGDHRHELDWKTMHSIAVGTARGIAYLHDECRNRILHCDIKPANVLLDTNFLPKVADFGLAKISDREESNISVAKRGTLGYSAPEMWSTEHGPVTDRSDVYSYGMLVMEMVGGRRNIDYDQKSTASKFFYADWAFNQVQEGKFGDLRKERMSEEDQLIAKKLSLVGLWCLQFNASSRPSISRVIQMLEGGDDIPIPPAPPFPLPIDTPQQRCASNQSSSSYALPVERINMPEQRCASNQASTSYASEVEMINTPQQRSSFNQSSSSYALEMETINPNAKSLRTLISGRGRHPPECSLCVKEHAQLKEGLVIMQRCIHQ